MRLRLSCGPAVTAVVALSLAAAAVAELTPSEERGKTLYFEGVSPAGREATAILGEAGAEVPASLMPCSNCHGRDGRGRPEGGVYPSNVTWPAMTKPYGVEHPGGRRHPPYDERLLARAIADGVDPAGNPLHVAMPRYRLADEDMADLVAYIKRLGEDLDPGLTGEAIGLATLLPREGPTASLGAAMEAVLRAYFDDVNQRGGIYHRRLELRVEPASPEPAERAAALRRLLAGGQVFALVGVFLPGAEAEVVAVVEELGVPLVGPFTLQPQVDGSAPAPHVFYLLPGMSDLARSLVTFAAAEADGEPPRAAVVAGDGPGLAAAGRAVAEKVAALGWPAAVTVAAAGPDLATVTAADTVFLLASGDAQAGFFRSAAELGWYPRVLLPGALLERGVFAAPPGFAGRIFAAFPTLPSNQDPRAVEEYRRLAERYQLPERHLTAQIAALASARVLVEGLKGAGRDASRGRLVEVLEGLAEYDTGLTPPVTYGPNRRVGVRGAYVLAVDLERQTLVPASGWIELR